MQRTERIKVENLSQLLHSIYSNGDVMVFESYSGLEEEIVNFETISALETFVQKSLLNGMKNLALSLYFPESSGIYQITKIQLDPKRCNGKTFRFRIDGWGLIHINFDFTKSPKEFECRVSVNSEKRALNWESTVQEIPSPKGWNWRIVESKARKMISTLKKLRTTSAVGNGG